MTTELKKINAVIYARYSSHNQTEASIEGQLKVCYEYAKQNHITVIGEYVDRAMSGTNDNREQFQKMLKDSAKKQFDGVLVYQLDRFGRNNLECSINEDKLNKNGVEVYSAKENFTKDPSGNLLKGVIRSVNQYYSDELSVKVGRGMDLNADKFYYNGGSVPLGLALEVVEEINGPFNKKIKKQKFTIDESTAPIVQKIFEMYNNGHTMADIIRYLNKLNIKTSRGNEFTKNSLRDILRNKKYIGIYSYRGKETPDIIPRIIDDITFNKAQEKLKKNKQAPSRGKAIVPYVLTGKLYCGTCKNAMVGISGTSGNKELHCYYGCKGTKEHKCDRKYIPKDYIEDLVIEKAISTLTAENIEKIANAVYETACEQEDKNRIKYLQREIIKLENKNRNLLDSLSESETPEIRKIVFDKLKSVSQQKEELEKELRIEENSQFSYTIEQIKYFLINLKKKENRKDIKYRKMIVNSLINRIYVYDDNITILFNTQDKEMSETIPTIDELEKSFCSFNGRNARPSKVAFAGNCRSTKIISRVYKIRYFKKLR